MADRPSRLQNSHHAVVLRRCHLAQSPHHLCRFICRPLPSLLLREVLRLSRNFFHHLLAPSHYRPHFLRLLLMKLYPRQYHSPRLYSNPLSAHFSLLRRQVHPRNYLRHLSRVRYGACQACSLQFPPASPCLWSSLLFFLRRSRLLPLLLLSHLQLMHRHPRSEGLSPSPAWNTPQASLSQMLSLLLRHPSSLSYTRSPHLSLRSSSHASTALLLFTAHLRPVLHESPYSPTRASSTPTVLSKTSSLQTSLHFSRPIPITTSL